MRIATLCSLSVAGRELGVSRNLVAFLVTDRRIPFHSARSRGGVGAVGQGRAKFLDAEGMDRLRAALADYQGNVESASV